MTSVETEKFYKTARKRNNQKFMCHSPMILEQKPETLGKAIKCYKKAIKKGNSDPMNNYALLIQENKVYGKAIHYTIF